VAEAIRRYDLIERIATGGMGEVYRARVSGDRGESRTVAVKRLLPRQARDPALVRRFVQEAKTAMALRHPNIVAVHDVCQTADELLIIMELVEGADLGMLLAAMSVLGERTPLPIAMHVLREALAALAYAHAAQPGVVHCDISPSNLLVGESGEVKITDFGVAQSVHRARGGSEPRVIGKLRYMSPQQVRGEPVDPRADLYSLGVVAWEMLTMQPLFRSLTNDEDEIARKVLKEEAPRVSSLRVDVPPALDELVAQTLAKDPAARPVDALAMIRVLDRIAVDLDPIVNPAEVGAWVRVLARGVAETPSSPRDKPLDLDDTDPGASSSHALRRGQPMPRPRTLTFRGKTTTEGVLVLRDVRGRQVAKRWGLFGAVMVLLGIALGAWLWLGAAERAAPRSPPTLR
jgi:serine/threonine protein kinase